MNTEQKARAYDKVREKIALRFGSNVAEEIFSEIEMSKDERIRKAIIELVRQSSEILEKKNQEQMIAWLEKQKSEEINVKALLTADKLAAAEMTGRLKERKDIVENPQKYGLEKQSEPADEVKPQFHKGEWVVFNNRHDSVYQVEKIENYEYTLRHFLGGSMPLSFSHEDMIRAWTIQDAKDGDVLVCEGKISMNKNGQEIGIVKKYVGRIGGCDTCFETYCFIAWEGDFRVGKHMGSPNIHPATKEQRDTLFAKMKEAGYTFDFEKKELKKIENEEYDGEDYGIDSLYHAQRILEKTLGSVDGYQTDDGILDHKCAITAIKKLYEQKPVKCIEFNNEFENQVSNLLVSVLNGEHEYNEGFVKYVAQSLLGYAKNELKPTGWSEGDEYMLNETIQHLEELIRIDKAKHLGCYIQYYQRDIDWLKSLKQKHTWKPSEEQISALDFAIDCTVYPEFQDKSKVLIELLEQLKKLTE